MKRLLLCFIILINYSCSNDKRVQVSVVEFPLTKELNAVVVETDPVILAPVQMFIFNNQLWLHQKIKDRVFSVFSLPDCKYLYSTGVIGRGANEFVHPIANTAQVQNNNNFTILDLSVVKTIALSDSGHIKTIKTETIFDLLPINGFIQLNDSIYCAFADCATGTYSNFEYRLKNINRKEEVKFSEYPDLASEKYEKEQKCQMYYKNLVTNPTKSKFAAYYSFFKHIRIYNFDMELEKDISVEIVPFEINKEKRRVFYAKPFSTENYIYAPCFSKEIQVWDWEGSPVALLSLDNQFICYAIDEKEHKLYTVSSEEGSENKIYTYDLSF